MRLCCANLQFQMSITKIILMTFTLTSLLSLSRTSSPSDILIVVRRSEQRFNFNRLVILKVRPEEVEPVAMLRLKGAEKVAFEEIGEIFASATVERRFSTFRDKVSISAGD